jgi:hypothetical protein
VQCDLLPAELRLDMILWDDHCGYGSRLNSKGKAIANHYTFAKQDLKLMADQFAMIESCAERWPSGQD